MTIVLYTTGAAVLSYVLVLTMARKLVAEKVPTQKRR